MNIPVIIPKFEDLRVGELMAQLGKELIVNVLVGDSHLLGEADGQLLPVGQIGILEMGQRGHHLLGHSLLHRRHSAAQLSSGALVQLGYLQTH